MQLVWRRFLACDRTAVVQADIVLRLSVPGEEDSGVGCHFDEKS